MKENKDQQSKVNTCFEEAPCAEMMQKIMSEQGIGSLCEEMMRWSRKKCREGKEAPRKPGNEEGHGPEDPSYKTED